MSSSGSNIQDKDFSLAMLFGPGPEGRGSSNGRASGAGRCRQWLRVQ